MICVFPMLCLSLKEGLARYTCVWCKPDVIDPILYILLTRIKGPFPRYFTEFHSSEPYPLGAGFTEDEHRPGRRITASHTIRNPRRRLPEPALRKARRNCPVGRWLRLYSNHAASLRTGIHARLAAHWPAASTHVGGPRAEKAEPYRRQRGNACPPEGHIQYRARRWFGTHFQRV
jgi:hypothetical protein